MELQKKYRNILNDFVNESSVDKNILTIILTGGLYHKYINENSDINLIIVVQDDKVKNYDYTCIYQDIIFDIVVFSRTQIIQNLTNQTGDYYRYSYLSDNEILFSRDESLNEILNQVRTVKQDYFDKLIISGISEILFYIREIKKCLDLKKDTLYTQYFFVKAAETLTRIEHAADKKTFGLTPLADAYKLNSDLFEIFYKEALTEEWTVEKCYKSIDILNKYIDKYVDIVQKPIVRLFKIMNKEILTLGEIARQFQTFPPFILLFCQWLTEKGIIAQVTLPVELSKKGNFEIEQIAYFYNIL
ncbi:MAG: hypothetical protein FWD71_16835 [Oscillospiraceae bacterium]|nr:hypothetical protein [Oscillospiraceae bacterium]